MFRLSWSWFWILPHLVKWHGSFDADGRLRSTRYVKHETHPMYWIEDRLNNCFGRRWGQNCVWDHQARLVSVFLFNGTSSWWPHHARLRNVLLRMLVLTYFKIKAVCGAQSFETGFVASCRWTVTKRWSKGLLCTIATQKFPAVVKDSTHGAEVVRLSQCRSWDQILR